MPELRYKHLVNRLADDIRAGRLRPGNAHADARRSRRAEGVALDTGTRVDAELQAMRLVSGETGRGTVVKEPLPRGHGIDLQVWSGDTVDLSFNNPSLPDQTAFSQLALSGDLESLLRISRTAAASTNARQLRHICRAGVSKHRQKTCFCRAAGNAD